MPRLTLAVLLGIGCALLACAIMIPLRFPSAADKRRAIAAAFVNRFELGFVATMIGLPLPAPVSGALVGLVVSAPSAIVTRTYAPILVMGVLMGALSAWIAS
jgi:hypothetical protein